MVLRFLLSVFFYFLVSSSFGQEKNYRLEYNMGAVFALGDMNEIQGWQEDQINYIYRTYNDIGLSMEFSVARRIFDQFSLGISYSLASFRSAEISEFNNTVDFAIEMTNLRIYRIIQAVGMDLSYNVNKRFDCGVSIHYFGIINQQISFNRLDSRLRAGNVAGGEFWMISPKIAYTFIDAEKLQVHTAIQGSINLEEKSPRFIRTCLGIKYKFL